MPRSGGSTGFTYVDMAKRPGSKPLARRYEPPATIPARLAALGVLPELRVGHHAAPPKLGALRGRLEVRLRGRLGQGGRGRRVALGIRRIADRLGLRRNVPCELGPLLLKLHAQPGELALDLADRLLALVEPLPLRLRQSELLYRFLLALLGRGDRLGQLLRALRPDGSGSAAAALPAGHVEAHVLELLLARGDVLRVLAQGA